jgi:hypothetical protein
MTWKPKQDIEYIGKVEKAIKEKYGEEATINPRSLWDEQKEQEYLEQVKQNATKYYEKDQDDDILESDGIFISKKLLSKSNSTSCPVCDKYMMDSKQSVYIAKWQCCHDCYIKYVDGREDRWLTGWRPERK